MRNGHGTPTTCGLVPPNITYGSVLQEGAPCPSCHPVSTVRQCHKYLTDGPKRLTQAVGTASFHGHPRPFMPSNIVSLDLKKHLP